MDTSISNKQTKNSESFNLVNVLVTKRFNEILMTVVSVTAVLVILWG